MDVETATEQSQKELQHERLVTAIGIMNNPITIYVSEHDKE